MSFDWNLYYCNYNSYKWLINRFRRFIFTVQIFQPASTPFWKSYILFWRQHYSYPVVVSSRCAKLDSADLSEKPHVGEQDCTNCLRGERSSSRQTPGWIFCQKRLKNITTTHVTRLTTSVCCQQPLQTQTVWVCVLREWFEPSDDFQQAAEICSAGRTHTHIHRGLYVTALNV